MNKREGVTIQLNLLSKQKILYIPFLVCLQTFYVSAPWCKFSLSFKQREKTEQEIRDVNIEVIRTIAKPIAYPQLNQCGYETLQEL